MKMMPSALRVLWLPVLMAMSGGAGAQTPPPPQPASAAATPPAPPPCTRSENRQFDFWIGDWDVTTPDGKLAGTNLIKPILNGCVLHENWKGRGGFTGESFNVYDARRKVWHQTWVDGTGSMLMMDGRWEGGVMTLSDKDMPGKPDANAISEIAWTPNADGSVRQLWRTSADGGKTWQTAFDGKYVRSERPQPKR
ncbi:MAG: hypothetical protein JNN20_00045 [Betaproteobacteria bacterium]|nr:hypothetical protein [Betaproteobacteria bacterium]